MFDVRKKRARLAILFTIGKNEIQRGEVSMDVNVKQKAHAWIALRALKLIEDSEADNSKSFVELLTYYISDVWEGAWLPDILIKDMGYGHIFKMDNDSHFVKEIDKQDHRKVPYAELKKKLKGTRLCLEYAKDCPVLDKPYWVNNTDGHLPSRVIAINHSIIDMLKMGDYPMAFYLKNVDSMKYKEDLLSKKVKDLSISPNFSARQIALTFFITSHYIADAHMPLHCDLRDKSKKRLDTGNRERRLPEGLHPGIEKVWEKSMPPKKYLTLHGYTQDSINKVIEKLPKTSLIELDTNSDYELNTTLYKSMPNEWDEMKNICRTSFAVSRKWITKSFKKIEKDVGPNRCVKNKVFNEAEVLKVIDKDFKDVTNRIFHDAVESVARLWYRAWNIFCK